MKKSATLKKNAVNKLFMSHNVEKFKNKWAARYKIDLELYEKDPEYNLV
ncbi:MAG: hypothetical protein HC877_22465 [Thioploca sp.]|nr:hypothetical protein [Thioploca sp.]